MCVYPSKRIHVAVCGPIGTKFGTHMQIHLEKVVGKIKICPVSRSGNLWGFRGSEIEIVGNLPNGWTDWPQIWYPSADSYGNGHRLKTNSPSKPGGSFWDLGGQNVIKSLRNAMICREKMKINYIKMKCTNRHNYAATIPGEAG